MQDELLGAPAVSFGEQTLTVADLVLIGELSGTWPAFLDATARGVALQERCDPVPPAELRAAATAFRYRRGLLSASEFVAWLAGARLEAADLAGVLTRAWLRERHPDDGERGETEAVLYAELLCTGTLATLVREATDRLAAQAGLGENIKGTVPLMSELDAGLQRFAARVADEEAIRRRLADHRLDWLKVSGEECAFAREGAAREARLLVREGAALAEVARLAGTHTDSRHHLVGSAPPVVAGALASATPGELVGPWEQDGAWRVLLVTAKSAPHAGDPELSERAARELLDDAIARLSAGRVRRHVAV